MCEEIIPWINLASSIILALLTGIYVWQNKLTIDEMVKARKAQAQPAFKLSLRRYNPFGGSYPLAFPIQLTNIGTGSAIDAEASITWVAKNAPDSKEVAWRHPLVPPGFSEVFLTDMPDLDGLAAKYVAVKASGHFKDVFGDSHDFSDSIDIKSIAESWKQGQMMIATTIEGGLEDIRHSLEDIKSELSQLRGR